MLDSLKNIITPKRYKDCYSSYYHEKQLTAGNKIFYHDNKKYEVGSLADLLVTCYEYPYIVAIFIETIIYRLLQLGYVNIFVEVIIRAIIIVIISQIIMAISIRLFVKLSKEVIE